MATSVQFSIRSLLVAMVLTAVGLAAAMPVIRTWSTAAQSHFVINAIVLAGLVGMWTVYRCLVRRRVERLAGEVVLRAATQGNRFARFFYGCLLILFILGLFLVAASETPSTPVAAPFSAERPWISLVYLGGRLMYLAWITGCLVTNCWWGTGFGVVELAENGLIVRGIYLTPYAHFRTVRWNRYFCDNLVLSSLDHQLIQIIVPRWEREHIERFLARKGLVSSQVEDAKEGCESSEPEDHGVR